MKYLFLCTLLVSFSVYSSDFKVSALRGEAKLENTKSLLKVNDELRIDDVVVTSDKSFIKIAYANGGMITVGPNSSVKLLKQNKEQVSSLALLKGQVRAVFDKKENTNYKFFIKTRTAALGVRGTDFHFIYNPDNNVSTVLTYEGKVEFSEGDSIEGHDTIKVPKGYISGVFYHSSKASEPIKLSPLQFSLLLANQDLKEGSGQKVVTPKESKSIEKDTDLAKKDENIIPAPKNFLTDEYFEDRVKGNPTIRGGGYLDLKTGIYIDPPENSEYDAENDLYFPPVEFGGVDEESGEYVAPPGLILHPLKGFMFTTDVLQKGFHNVTSVVQSGVTPVVGAVTYVGEKSYDTLKNSAAMLRDNTGPVGTTVAKGVDLVGTGVTTTLDTAENTSSFILNTTADTLNYAVHDIFLTRIKNVKDQIPFINNWRIKFNQGFNYNHINADKYNLYDRSIVRESTVESQTNLDVKYQKNFYTNFFVRPRFEMKWKNYLGSNGTLKGYDKLIFYYGSDFGYSTTNKEMKYQTFVSIEKGKTRQGQDSKDEFITHEDSWRFGLTKLILGQKTFSTTLDYHFEHYNDPFDGRGDRHQFDISEIVSISDTRLIKLTVDWNKILQDKYGDTTNWGTKLNFFMTTLKWNMSYDIWGGLRFLSNTGTLVKRDSERNYFLGASLTKSFANSFSVQFSYEILKQTSPLQTYKYVSQEFATNIYYIF